MDICEYVKDEYGYWQYREWRNVAVFHLDLHKSHIQTSTIRLGRTRAFGARVTDWRDIHFHFTEYLTPELLNQSGHNHLVKIGEDFFGVCDECDRIDYNRRKIKTYFLRYLEHKSANLIDAMLCETA
jgi:hypothetical protein